MTESITFEVKYKAKKMEFKIVIHRSWCIARLKHELAFVLNISAGRITCKSRMKEALRDCDDIDEYWMFTRGKIEIVEKWKRSSTE
jgi:hypothetical protein